MSTKKKSKKPSKTNREGFKTYAEELREKKLREDGFDDFGAMDSLDAKLGFASGMGDTSSNFEAMDATLGLTTTNEENPIYKGVEYTGTTEADTKKDLDAVQKAFKQQKEQFKIITGTGYYFCVCFESTQQKAEFLAAIGLAAQTVEGMYLDGFKLADKMGVKLKTPRVRFPKIHHGLKKLQEFA